MVLSVLARPAQCLRTAISRVTGYCSLAYFSAAQAVSAGSRWAGALLLMAIPVAEIAIGLDVITAVALIAPVWAVLIAIAMTGVYLYRRRRHRKSAE
ncbi:hypothetical protein [Nocardia arthritidis]|uniref:Uncharacterized protein n=1 Tax=Nocardia arthritidis TaxID=228602 RepID=A0A6G9YG29_9NOCA|nr:hypothetical protein [Nocardia arthritidis]QIS12162.1 hypothetical protein F5544_21495 [Nocardia arthritidis]